jgi:iron complex outermembrane receptor protein
VGEIVVTAQKREENLQDVPIAISAFSAEQMDARGVTGIKDLGISTPSLQFTDFVGYTLIYLRGIGTDTFIPSADPSVATYIDGVYFPGAHSLGQSFGALERIEVLKGPQGTLFGRNATGGAISVVTKKPGHEPETSVQVSYGRFDDLKTRAYTNIPLTDWMSLSVSGFYNHSESYYRQDNPRLPDELPHDVSRGGRVKLGFYPSEDIDIVLTALGTRQEGPTPAIGVNTHPSLLGSLALIQGEDRDFVTPNDDSPYVATDIDAYYGEITWRLPAFDLKAIGSDFYIKTHDYRVDFDGSPIPLVTSQVNADGASEYQDLASGELQILSNADSWGSEWLKWIAGFYYFEAEGGYAPVHLTVANTVIQLPNDELINLIPEPLFDLLEPIIAPLPFPDQIGLKLFGAVGTQSYSGYLQTTMTLTDWLDLTLGGRYQREKRSLVRSDVRIDNIGGDHTTLIPFAPRDATSKNFSPRVSLDFRVIEDTLLYLSYSRGYKSATYNIVNVYLPPDYIKPEEVNAYELGAKSALLDGNLRVNAAVFQNDIKELQASFVSLLAGGAVQFENAGKARVRGAEIDFTLVPLPGLNPGLVFTGNGSYLDAVYTDFENGSGFNETTGIFSGGNDFSGNQISRVPEYTWSLGLSQTVEMPGGPLEIAGDYFYNDGFYFLAQNTPESYESSYALVSARLSYLYRPAGLRLTLFGNNLTDEKYHVSQFFTDFGRLDSLAAPRTYGVRLNWDF